MFTNKTAPLHRMMTSSNGNIFRVTGPLCGEITGPGEFPTQRPVTRSFDVFFDLRLNKWLSKQPWGWWFETPSWSLWRYRDGTWMFQVINLWHNEVIWRHRSGLILAQSMACCLKAPYRYKNQYWVVIKGIKVFCGIHPRVISLEVPKTLKPQGVWNWKQNVLKMFIRKEFENKKYSIHQYVRSLKITSKSHPYPTHELINKYHISSVKNWENIYRSDVKVTSELYDHFRCLQGLYSKIY